MHDIGTRLEIAPTIDYSDRLLVSASRQSPAYHVAAAIAPTTAVAALEAAYANQGQNAALYQDDGAGNIGAITPHAIINSQTISGTRVDSLTWPRGGQNGEYATGRSYEIALSGELALTGETTLISFAETLSFVGTTGPREVLIEIRNGPPRRQRVSQRTSQRITQSGNAIGLASYPTVPAPIFPAIEHESARRRVLGSPRQNGRVFTDYPISWAYEFETAFAVSGVPNAI